jgi:large subunit ribosomal protein L13
MLLRWIFEGLFGLSRDKENPVNTYLAKESEITRAWHVIDAEGQTLGRLSTVVATLLRGKHKPTYTPTVDCGDFVVIINADKIRVTGKKVTDKVYRHHTGFPGGFRQESFEKLSGRKPVRILEKAIKGMLPHTKLGDVMYGKLKVYAGAEHPHEAQKPVVYTLSK